MRRQSEAKSSAGKRVARLVIPRQFDEFNSRLCLGSRDELGREIGLLNPPLPVDGHIAPPETPGWGAEWDRAYFAKKRVAEW